MHATRKLILFAVVGIAASGFLIPSELELGLMRVEAQKFELAQSTLEAQIDKGEWSPMVVHSLAKIYVSQKRPELAITLMEQFMARAPEDVDALIYLAKLYQQSERYTDYRRALERLMQLRPAEQFQHDLAALYRMQGDKEKEFSLLADLFASKQATLEEQLYYALYLAEMNDPAAMDLLFTLFRERPHAFDMAAKQTLVTQLLGVQRREDALNALLVWFPPPRLSRAGLAMADWLTSTEKKPLAQDFLQDFTQVEDKYAALYAHVLHTLGETDKLIDVWLRQLAGATLSVAEQKEILHGLIDAGAAEQTLPYLRTHAESAEEDWLWLYQLALQKSGRASEWEDFLANALNQRRYAPEDLRRLADFLVHASSKRAAQTLSHTWKHAPLTLLDVYLYALQQLPAGTIQAQEPINLLTQTNLTGARRAVVLDVLERAHPADTGRLWLREQALKGEEDAAYRYKTWLKKSGKPEDLRQWYIELINSPAVSLQMKRGYAFELVTAGHKRDAIRAYQSFAEITGPDSDDMRELLYLCGPRPHNEFVDWLETQARNARDQSQLRWLDHLLDVGAYARVLHVSESALSDRNVALRRLNALAHLHRNEEFTLLLGELLRTQSDESWVAAAAKMAQQAGFDNAALLAWKTVCRKNTPDAHACREAGLLAFKAGDHKLAQKALMQFVKAGPADVDALYALGESQKAVSGEAAARQTFARGLQTLRRMQKLEAHHARLEALFLFRLGHTKEAIGAYENLLKQYPHDAELKADYIATLMDQQFYDKALQTLQ